jgi:hypothetical protein
MEGGNFDRSLRAWEPLEGESTSKNKGKPWMAFKIFRDLGPERTLKTAAAAYYHHPYDTLPEHLYNQVKKWATRFDWHDRVQGFDDHYEMMERQAVERHMAERRENYYERELRIKEGALEVREQALEQARKMVGWPLSEQRIIREEDGEEVTVILMPAGWNDCVGCSMQAPHGEAVQIDDRRRT